MMKTYVQMSGGVVVSVVECSGAVPDSPDIEVVVGSRRRDLIRAKKKQGGGFVPAGVDAPSNAVTLADLSDKIDMLTTALELHLKAGQ